MRSNRALPVLAALALAGFCLGVTRLFQLRFEAGDVYPPYSSLRSDPLGAKVLYESLRDLGLSVERNERALHRLSDGREMTLFLLGADPNGGLHLSRREVEALEAIAASGGRILLSLRPEARARRRDSTGRKREVDAERDEGEQEEGEPVEEPQGKPEEPEPSITSAQFVSLAERWGFSPRFGGAQGAVPRAHKAPGAAEDLPAEIPWRSGVSFEDLAVDWRAVYTRDGFPVLVERGFGAGTIALSSDSYLLSNEALWGDRQPELLAWLVGPTRRIVFDETHLGVRASPGVASLARRYRLHGFAAGLGLLLGLALWRNSARLCPRKEDRETDRPTPGQDAATGLGLLLRRSIPGAEILTTCLREWERTGPSRARDEENLRRAREIVEHQESLPPRQRDPAGAYREICEVIAERRRIRGERGIG